MTDKQWNDLLAVLRGEQLAPLPAGFIIDSPWLPRWCGHEIADYLASENVWFDDKRKAIETFPQCMFLPGFWSEFGMCTEPSAFGSRCMFPANDFPFADKIITDPSQTAGIQEPNPVSDGLLPLVLRRLKWARPRIEDIGHRIRFSVSRGPLNVASFLMGTTEFLMAIKTDPQPMHRLLRTVTNFLKRWHALQIETFPSIQGIMMLDDIVGFMSEEDFAEFALPYLRELYAVELPVRFFHNDAPCEKSVKYYPEIGINLFNPGIQSTINEINRLSDNRLTVLGNIPPRDVLAAGTPDDVRSAVRKQIAETADHSRLIISCGGGMPPAVTTGNIRAFLDAVRV